jgi:hypothetical protein
MHQLALKSEVSFTGLRRLMQKDGPSELVPHFVLNLSSFLLKELDIAKLIEKTQGPLKEFLKKNFAKFIATEATVKSQASVNISWQWISLNAHYYLYVHLTKRSQGLNWAQVPETWRAHFQDIHVLALNSSWVQWDTKGNLFWVEATLEIQAAWKIKHESVYLQYLELTSELVEKTPLILAEVGWDTFEKISCVLDKAKLDCLNLINHGQETSQGKISIYLSASLGLVGKLGQSHPPLENG